MRLIFDWDPKKAQINRRKHGVSFEQAMEVFSDSLSLSIADDANEEAEQRWVTIGQGTGRPILVVHTFDESDGDTASIRTISARSPIRREMMQYREGTNQR